MKNLIPLLAGPLGVVAVSALVWSTAPRPTALQTSELVVIPFAVDAVRTPGVTAAQVLVYEPREAATPTRVDQVRVHAGGVLLHQELVAVDLFGAPDYGEVNALIERLPESITELHRERRWFAAEEATEFAGPEAYLRWNEVAGRVEDLRQSYANGAPRPFVEVDVPLPLDQLFAGDEAPGTERVVTFEVAYTDASGVSASAEVEHVVRWLGPAQQPSPTLADGTAVAYAGDLHVHSCHGEAVNACAPSSDCAAESFQTSGSFSYAQLKTQYQALDIDWITATDHSYCIASNAEYTAIVGEIAAINEPGFLAFPDIELSSEEGGSQSGGDSANILCLFATPQNHMGAHGITSRKAGGSPGFLGFCSGLAGFAANAAAVRAEGGWPIVHHPAADAYAWNSVAATQGIESGQMHGVEIWNGPTWNGEGNAVASWVDWLLDGRILYGYSGSDTHDAAFAFGANHAVLVDEPFSSENILSAVFGGRVYVSDQHSLQTEVTLGGEDLFMGTLHALPVGASSQAATVNVHYDFGGDTATISVYQGRAGDGSETLLCTSAPLTGAGVFPCAATVSGSVNSWYRAESVGAGFRAFTNPVFFLAGTGDVASYCTAKVNSQGCTPTTSWNGLPSASLGSPFTVNASNVLNNKSGLLFYGQTSSALPFQGGTKCVAAPTKRTPLQDSGGNAPPNDCSGTYELDFKARIQSGIDPGLSAGTTIYCQFWSRDPASGSTTGLTDAVRFTIQP